MKSHHFCIIAGFLVLAMPRPASAATEYIDGAVCSPLRADAGKVDYSRYGVLNTSTTSTASVACSAGYTTVTGQTVRIYVYDRDEIIGENVCCTLRLLTADGSEASSFAQQCTTGSSMNVKTLDFGPTTTGGMVYADCTMPKKTANESYVTAIRFTT
jgi:hypothetical protein